MPEQRTDSERDVDKFYYTYPFRRLAQITQVSPEVGATLPHNRMTHSLKVAQVGHRLAQYLCAHAPSEDNIRRAGGLDPNAAQAAGMAHDMGHPPFGHIGEDVLDSVACEAGLDGYEGNAQTFRIITYLLSHKPHDAGLAQVTGMNLTPRTVAATVKYPWPRGKPEEGKRYKKFGYYLHDRERFEELVAPFVAANAGQQTVEAQVMDWADDVTYATHDIEDYYTSGLIPLERLAHKPDPDGDADDYLPLNPKEFELFWTYVTVRLEKYNRIPTFDAKKRFQHYASLFPRTPFNGTLAARAHIGSIVSTIITDATSECSITVDGLLDRGAGGTMDATISVFKQLTWYYVIDRPHLRSLQRGQKDKLRSLTSALIKWAAEATKSRETDEATSRRLTVDEMWANRRELPPILDELLRKQPFPTTNDPDEERRLLVRAVLDYVALMTETEVDRLHARLVLGVSDG